MIPTVEEVKKYQEELMGRNPFLIRSVIPTLAALPTLQWRQLFVAIPS